METEKTVEKLLALIEGDSQELVDLCLKLGNIPSPHGKEIKVGEAVMEWFKQNGIDGFLQYITDESVNAVGIVPGSGGGRSLILNAHLDTGPELGPDASESLRKIEGAWTENGLIFGKGVINDKAQLCAFMIAARAIQKAGICLGGDLIIAGVAFETGNPSVDEFRGINFPGEGFGTKWLVDRGVTADYALVGETSGFGIVRAECGAVWLKICVIGRKIYTPRIEHVSSFAENNNAFFKAAGLVMALEDWAIQYEKRERTDFAGGTISPKAQVVDVRGSEGNCNIYLDVRIAPGKNPTSIKKEIEQLAQNLKIACTLSIYQYSRGYIAQNAEPLIAALETAHRRVFGQEPPTPPSAEVSMWRDLNVFNEVGIPSVCYGPPRQREAMSEGQNRAMKISDLVAATKVYGLAILSLCGND